MHFGLYLVRKGRIDTEQFVAALESQLAELAPIGQLAIEEGALTIREVFEVLRAQSDLPPGRFGDTAVKLGVLTKSDLAMLLMAQSDRKRPLAEILVEQGVLTSAEAQEELSTFRRRLERRGGRPKGSGGPRSKGSRAMMAGASTS